MKVARDVMEQAHTVAPELSVPELARTLVEQDLDGVCVLEGDHLVGVVTAMDLVFRQRKVRTPMFIALLDLVVQVGGERTRRDLEKIGAVRVEGLMTRFPITVTPDTPLEDVATRMVDDHLSLIPVVEDGRLLGVVSRRSMTVATLRQVAGLG